ncbi:MAG: IS3 family transposase [Deltaproteobacteria bacterium]
MNHERVQRLMQQMGLQAVYDRRQRLPCRPHRP